MAVLHLRLHLHRKATKKRAATARRKKGIKGTKTINRTHINNSLWFLSSQDTTVTLDTTGTLDMFPLSVSNILLKETQDIQIRVNTTLRWVTRNSSLCLFANGTATTSSLAQGTTWS